MRAVVRAYLTKRIRKSGPIMKRLRSFELNGRFRARECALLTPDPLHMISGTSLPRVIPPSRRGMQPLKVPVCKRSALDAVRKKAELL